ncbi:hypothetical protein SAMN05444274_101610 [Mariniphaga anaerophila]|uniref:4-O-methyl-glucuronoyl methylesterase-like domain-containing protein n=1 Tax=Mariniphaga anaerophila TaxID=1484053 RepID=A0A1M4U8R1_9BACT|nr:hypothetical protein [Mariniphaga anaerophila]SHE53074.1 hypothetical protein SAMN05444274_101610 [Mariniphaga anaerophila]
MNNRILLLLVVCGIAFSTQLFSQDEKKYIGAIQNESDVPEYTLPDLLTTFSGKKIKTVKTWENRRRPELIKFFEENIYGKIPTPAEPIKKTFRVLNVDTTFLEGLCTKKRVMVTLSNSKGAVRMNMVVFTPNHLKGPFPAIYMGHTNVDGNGPELTNPQRYGQLNMGAPIRQMMLRGIALVASDTGGLVDGNKKDAEVLDGKIVDLFFQPGQTNTKNDEWGIMSIWAYSLSCGMDYLETDDDINSKQVAVLGCSVIGKTSLWAAALDQRFGMVLSATSGHGGDALWRRQFGETLDNMCEWLPRWIARNAQKYKGKINEMPVDQHMLLACIAPRPVFISSGQYDLWADGRGAYLGAYHAMPVYKMYGQNVAFKSEEQPKVNKTILKSAIGYEMRTAFHGLQWEDWENYMKFMEYHFMKIEPRSTHEIYYPDNKLLDHYPYKLSDKHIVK